MSWYHKAGVIRWFLREHGALNGRTHRLRMLHGVRWNDLIIRVSLTDLSRDGAVVAHRNGVHRKNTNVQWLRHLSPIPEPCSA